MRTYIHTLAHTYIHYIHDIHTYMNICIHYIYAYIQAYKEQIQYMYMKFFAVRLVYTEKQK